MDEATSAVLCLSLSSRSASHVSQIVFDVPVMLRYFFVNFTESNQSIQPKSFGAISHGPVAFARIRLDSKEVQKGTISPLTPVSSPVRRDVN
jgi:hypothetical protein